MQLLPKPDQQIASTIEEIILQAHVVPVFGRMGDVASADFFVAEKTPRETGQICRRFAFLSYRSEIHLGISEAQEV